MVVPVLSIDFEMSREKARSSTSPKLLWFLYSVSELNHFTVVSLPVGSIYCLNCLAINAVV